MGVQQRDIKATVSLLPVVTRVGASSPTLCSECFLGPCWPSSGASAPQGIYLSLKSNESGTFRSVKPSKYRAVVTGPEKWAQLGPRSKHGRLLTQTASLLVGEAENEDVSARTHTHKRIARGDLIGVLGRKGFFHSHKVVKEDCPKEAAVGRDLD